MCSDSYVSFHKGKSNASNTFVRVRKTCKVMFSCSSSEDQQELDVSLTEGPAARCGTLAVNKPAGRLVIRGRPSKATGPLLAPNCSTERRKGPQLYFQPRSRRAWYGQRLCLFDLKPDCAMTCVVLDTPCICRKSHSKAVRHIPRCKHLHMYSKGQH